MSRPLVLLLGLVLGCGLGPPPPPNVVLVTVDTLRADHVGAYGAAVPTPAMDALAAQGARVRHAYSPIPSTGPAMVSLLTGWHPWRHGVLLNAVDLDTELPSLPEELRRAGYQTAAFVSSYVVSARFGFDRGFDLHHFEPSQGGSPEGGVYRSERWWTPGGETTDALLRWLDARDDGPFFVWLHYIDPHDPYVPPAGFERPEDEHVDIKGKLLSGRVRSLEQLRRIIRFYRGSVAYTDFQIGRLVEGLRERDLLDRTLVVLTSDHGEGLGDHGLLGHGKNLHDELVRVPLVVRGPGIPAGLELDGLAQLEDLRPTILGLLGLPPPPEPDGSDLSAWLRGEVAASPRTSAVGRRAAYADEPPLFYARTGESTWIGRSGGAGRRYDPAADASENHGRRVRELPPALGRFGDALRSEGTARVLDEESRAGLEALGYLESDPPSR